METNYKSVDVYHYVNHGILDRVLNVIEAKKNAKVFARPGVVGEMVITWSEDDYHNPIVEREDFVTLDEETNQPGWVVTKVNPQEEIVVDSHGHSNQWIIRDSVFRKKYEGDFAFPGVFQSKGVVQRFVLVPEDIQIQVKTGATMNIASGGYLNITDLNCISGISERDFHDTYQVVSSQNQDNKQRNI